MANLMQHVKGSELFGQWDREAPVILLIWSFCLVHNWQMFGTNSIMCMSISPAPQVHTWSTKQAYLKL